MKTNKLHGDETASTRQERAGGQSRSSSKGGKKNGRQPARNITTVTKQGQNNKKWDEDIDPRIIRDRNELFVHENLPDVDLEPLQAEPGRFTLLWSCVTHVL